MSDAKEGNVETPPQGPYREPEGAPPLPPHPDIPWLGTKRFWLIALGALLTVSFGLFFQMYRVSKNDTLVAVVSLAGPADPVPGEKTRYGVLVRDNAGAVVPHARVRLGFYWNGFRELARGETGEDGSAAIDVTFPESWSGPEPIAAFADVGVAQSLAWLQVEARHPVRGQFLISTDKPMYQPGQIVHIRALAMSGTKPIANRAASLEIRTPDGTRVFQEDTTTSAFGVLSADFALAEQVKLGSYDIRVIAKPLENQPKDPGVDWGTASVEVKRYSLPKLKLTFEDLGTLKPDAPYEGTAKAMWIFGEPVTKGSVFVRLSQGGTMDRTARGQLDKDGKFRFVLPAPEKKQSWTGSITLSANVQVEGGLTATATTPIEQFTASGIKVEAFPEGGTLVGRVEQTVYVVVTGNPRENVTVWSTSSSSQGAEAKTDAQGIARLPVNPQDPDVTIHAKTPNGATASTSLSALKEGLVIRPDHESYDAGAKARIRIVGANAGDRVAARLMKASTPLLTGTCIVTNAAEGCDLSIVVPEVSGLVWIQAVSMPAEKSHEIHNAKRLIMVSGGGRDLALKVSADKPVYAPRDIGTVTVDVTGAGGKPIKAGVGVAVADEAVFALADVRPDLERQFFVVGQDYRDARKAPPSSYGRYGSSSKDPNEKDLPASFDRKAIYDANEPDSVRAAILAILTTMPEATPLDYATSSELANYVSGLRRDQGHRLFAWWVIALAAASFAALVLFGTYGILRLRRRIPSASSEGDRKAFLLETRGLITDWLLAVVAPLALTPVAMGGAALFGNENNGEKAVLFGTWSILALVGSWVLLRGALRVRRTAVAAEVPVLGRAVMLLPAAAFFGQLAILFGIGDSAHGVNILFDHEESRFFVGLFLVLAAQVVFGLLTVVRQSLLRVLSLRGAIWLLLSRASFVGLPVTLVLIVVLGVKIVRKERMSFAEAQMEDEREVEAAQSYNDSKEGGTGTRAKGEEGSMGNPNTTPTNKRYGVMADSEKKDEGPRVVRDWFPETLLWAPELPTDDKGHLSFKVPFADSITTWRLGLRAVSGAGQIGSSATPLVVMQDFFVDAALPATLTQDDELAVPVTVYSYLERGQDVSIDLEGDGMSAVGNAHQSVHLEPKESRGFRFTVKADKAGERVVRIKASTGSHSDVEERKVIVVPNGQEKVQTINARLVKSSKTDITLPANAIDGGNDLYAKVYGGPLSVVGEGLDGVFHMPHGCFEQTSSTTYPSILVLDFLKRSKQVSPEVEKKARGYLSQGYQRLLSFEVGNSGGFSLFGNSPADVALSAYGLLELADMARVTGMVDQNLLRRTSSWLLSKRAGNGIYITTTYDAWDRPTDHDAPLLTAYVGWALASAAALEKTPDPKVNELLDRVASLSGDDAESPYGLALRMNALIAANRKDAAKPLGEKLAASVIKNDEGVHWESKTSGVLYSYGSSHDIEVTGLATHALALADQHADLRSGALDWLVRLRGARGTWSTTQATIAAMRAMLDEAKPMPKEPQDITIVVDGSPAGNVRLETTARDVHHLVDLRRFATTGQHTIELKTPQDADVSYQVVATHWLPWKSPERAALGLDVSYAPTAITPGATTMLRAKLTWNGKLPAVMPLVEIPIPPSFEVETDDLEALIKNPDSVQRYTVTDGKITLYVTSIRADRPLTVNVRLRASRSARVIAPASVAYLYYEPEVRTETAPVLVRVN
jgi:hypothetical protein